MAIWQKNEVRVSTSLIVMVIIKYATFLVPLSIRSCNARQGEDHTAPRPSPPWQTPLASTDPSAGSLYATSTLMSGPRSPKGRGIRHRWHVRARTRWLHLTPCRLVRRWRHQCFRRIRSPLMLRRASCDLLCLISSMTPKRM